MELNCLFEDVEEFNVNSELLFDGLKALLADFNLILGDVSIVFCSDEYILNANQTYLQHDYYTDIITFDYSENDVVSGDLLISVDTVRSNAKLFNAAYEEELFRVVIHGMLHLCGLGDKSEPEITDMRIKEGLYLGLLSNPF